MDCFRIKRPSILAILFILPPFLTADVIPSGQQNVCTPCYSSVCTATCLQICPLTCPEQYYPSALVCETSPTSPTTTTTTTTTTLTTTTPTTVPTTTVPVVETGAAIPGNNTVNNVPSSPQGAAANRSRRQAPEGTTQEQPGVVETREAVANDTETTVATTTPTTTTTTSTTTTLPVITCRLCSLESCVICRDDSQNNSICEKCNDGYSLSDNRQSCSKDEFPVGAIVGIVIGGVCFIVVVVVVVVFVVRRFCWSRDGSSQEHPRKTMQSSTRNEDFDSEQYEIGKLGDAPTPPTEDASKGYDSLKVTNEDDPQSYSPLEIPPKSDYANCGTAEQKKNIYANTQQASATGASASEKPRTQKNKAEKSISQDSAKFYEPIGTTQHGEIQETYIDPDSLLEEQRSTIKGHEVYYNDDKNTVEDTYENT